MGVGTTDAEYLRIMEAAKNYGSASAAARELGENRVTFQKKLARARKKFPGVLPKATFDKRGGWASAATAKPRIRVKAGSDKPAPEEMRFRHIAPVSPAFVHGAKHVFQTDEDHRFAFGWLGDSHLCSKYERLDVLESLFDAFEQSGITSVFHTGNWIDGEARFNVYDLHTRGMDAQCRYLARVWPRREGITTYAVTGDDHEGWYAQREGVDIGSYAEHCFRDRGRTDWVNLGYMEAPVLIRNSATEQDAVLSVVHPGGGSSYATSYAVQKIIESLDGGEKPAIHVSGHYHKLLPAINIRNVWCTMTGCTQDQTPFMRKKKIEAHVGGGISVATQDPETGAIIRYCADGLRFFNRGYYAGRWSHHGDVVLPERGLIA